MKITPLPHALAGVLLALLLPTAAAAGTESSPTTYVATTGSDSDICAARAPCRLLSHALSVTKPGGTVFLMDAGYFGSATIERSVSIVALQAGAHLAPRKEEAAVSVEAGPDDVVSLDGVMLLGWPDAPEAFDGLRFLGGKALHLRNCTIRGFDRGHGVLVEAAGPTEVVIADCSVSDNRYGIAARSLGRSGPSRLLLDRVTVARNSAVGVDAGRRTVARLRGSTIVDNGVGLRPSANGRLVSFGDNVIDGSPTDSEALK